MPESSSSDKNAFANGAGPDKNIHKEQSGLGQQCLPSYTERRHSVGREREKQER